MTRINILIFGFFINCCFFEANAQNNNSLEVGYNYRYPGQFITLTYNHEFGKRSSINAGFNVSINRDHNRSLNTYFYNRIAPRSVYEAIGLSLAFQITALKEYYEFKPFFLISSDNNYSSSFLKVYSHHFQTIDKTYLKPYLWSELSTSFGLIKELYNGNIKVRLGIGVCFVYGDYGLEIETGFNELVSNAISKNFQVSYAFYLD